MGRLIKTLLFLLLFCTNVFAGINFSGDVDYLNCGDSTVFDGATKMTVGIVVDLSNDAVEQWFFSKYEDTATTSSNFMFGALDDGSLFGAILQDNSNYTFHSSDTGKTDDTAGAQVFMYVWDGAGNWSFYLNGVDAGDNVGADLGSPVPPNISTNLLISARYNTGAVEKPAVGTIHQLDVWKNTALNSTQAAQYAAIKRKDVGLTLGATASWWLNEITPGTSISGNAFVDRKSGISCTGTDADTDSLTVADGGIRDYQRKIVN